MHNWVYGNQFVLFTGTAAHPGPLVMPPPAYVAALSELVRLDLFGEHMARAMRQIGGWLAGPSESYSWPDERGRNRGAGARCGLENIDPSLRLIAWATLAQQCVGCFMRLRDATTTSHGC